MADLMARMGEMIVSNRDEDTLVAIGLGSCIGLAMVDRGRQVAGLAHIMLPDSGSGSGGADAKFADRAVPALLAAMARKGARPETLEVSIVGGAQMFAGLGGGSSSLDVGARNEAAAREAIRAAGLVVRAAATGGSTGRTARVRVSGGTVTVKAAGGEEEVLRP